MANRYWVGGSGNWSDDEHHWATSSDGNPGVGNLPTSSDNVFIDSNSGLSGGTITLDISDTNFCNDFTSNSGYTYKITWADGEYLAIYGSYTGENGLTWDEVYIDFDATTTGKTITTNEGTLYGINFNGIDGGWTLQDDLTITGEFGQQNGTFDANDHNITANDFSFFADTGYTPTVIMGSGTWEATTNDDDTEPWYVDQYNDQVVTFTPETSTIKFTDASEYRKTLYFYDDTGNEIGKTYYNIWFSGAGTGAFYIVGSNTFNDFKVDTPPHTVYFQAGTTQIINGTPYLIGTAGNPIILDSDVDAVEGDTLDKAPGTTIDDNSIGTIPWVDTDNVKVDDSSYATAVFSGAASSHYLKITNFGFNIPDNSIVISADVYIKGKTNVGFGEINVAELILNDEAIGEVGGLEGNLGTVEITARRSFYNLRPLLSSDDVNNSAFGFRFSVDTVQALTASINYCYISLHYITPDDSRHIISKSSGIVSCDYLNISNSNATGGANWYAGSHSVNTINNTGWIFSAANRLKLFMTH